MIDNKKSTLELLQEQGFKIIESSMVRKRDYEEVIEFYNRKEGKWVMMAR